MPVGANLHRLDYGGWNSIEYMWWLVKKIVAFSFSTRHNLLVTFEVTFDDGKEDEHAHRIYPYGSTEPIW
jgi:hypothetical protein